jgi:hypothetical protein
MDRSVERWKRLIAENTRVAEMLESRKMRAYLGPGPDAVSDVSAAEAKRLRTISAELQRLVKQVIGPWK